MESYSVRHPPSFGVKLLASLYGTGAQLVATGLVVLCVGTFGFVNPSRRGSALMFLLCSFVGMGFVGGYAAARIYRITGGQHWSSDIHFVAALTACLFPGVAYVILFVTTMTARVYGSSSSLPFLSYMVLVVLWLFILLPLVFVGAFVGAYRRATPFPVSVASEQRPVPARSFLPLVTTIVGGGATLVVAGNELFYIMASIWQDSRYYSFGYAITCFVLALITCAAFSVLSTFQKLQSEDHRWWWHAFVGSGSTSLWFFAFFCYYSKRFDSPFIGTYVIYFGYMLLACFALFLGTGYVGMSASLWFNRRLYGSLGPDDDLDHGNEMNDMSGLGQYRRLEDGDGSESTIGGLAQAFPMEAFQDRWHSLTQRLRHKYLQIPESDRVEESVAEDNTPTELSAHTAATSEKPEGDA